MDKVELFSEEISMKRKIIILVVIFSVLTSCRFPENWLQPTPTLAPMDSGQIQPPQAALIVQMILADELMVQPETIIIRQIEQVEWADSCLEFPAPGEVCTQQIIPGFRITLMVENIEYTYHTDFPGDVIRRDEQLSPASPAANQAVQLLAGLLGYDPAAIRVLSEREEVYEDTCLEINISELPCGQFSTRGIAIRLLAENIVYEFRTPTDSVNLILADVDGLSTVIPVLNWSRRGGREEYCDGLKVYLSGSIIQYNCRDYAGQNPGISRLSPEDLRQLLHWYLQYTPFEYNLAGFGGSVVQLFFIGRGQESPDFDQQQEIDAFCTRLLAPVLTGTLPPSDLTPQP
jgi:hypothetical protein